MTHTTPNEDLVMIRKIMQDAHQSILADGKPFIAFGIAFAIATGYTYVAALRGEEVGPWIWFGAMIGAGLYLAYDLRQNRNRTENFASKMIGTIWGAAGGAVAIVATALAFSNAISGEGIMAVISVILGIAYLITGAIYGLAWFRNLGYGWWAGAIAIAWLHNFHVLGIYLFMIVFFEIVPGVILYRNGKRSNDPTAIRA